MTIDGIRLILEGAIVLFTAVAAFGAWWAARATHIATQAQLLRTLLDDYSNHEMLDAMLKLRRWKQKCGSGFADEFRVLRQNKYDDIIDLDRARRRVSHHFAKICTLHNAGLCNERLVRVLAVKEQVEFYREIVEPLEAALNSNYDKQCFDYLGSLYDIPRYLPPMANPQS